MLTAACSATLDALTVPRPQHSLQTFDFQTKKFWIWVGVAYCLGLFVLFTLVSGLALRFIDPPHAQVILTDTSSTRHSVSDHSSALSSADRLCIHVSVLPAPVVSDRATIFSSPALTAIGCHHIKVSYWGVSCFAPSSVYQCICC